MEDRRGQESAIARQGVAWMVQVYVQDNAYSPPNLDQWIVDSRASHHVTSQQVNLITYNPASSNHSRPGQQQYCEGHLSGRCGAALTLG